LHQLSSRIGTKLTIDNNENENLSDDFEEEAKESLSMMAPVGFRPLIPHEV